MKIKIKDINGNWVWYDTETKLATSAEVLLGTIRNNAVKSVGADTSTKKGRVMAAYNQTQSYNRRLHKVHNYADQTTRLKLKQLTVSVDNTGEPIINQTDYNPGVEAPMKPYTPLEEFYVGAKVLDLPFKFGSKAVQYGLGRYGSKFGWNEALLSARNKILSDVFDRQSLKLITPLTTTLLYLTLKFTPITTPNEEGALTFFLRKPSKISSAERMGIPKGERNVKQQGYLLKDAIEEANKFAEKWGYDKLPQNATLLDIENLYNQHNTFFRGVTTEQFENTRNRIAKELGINPELLTNDLYLLYVSTHPWPGNDRIWVTPFSHYGEMYGNTDMIGGKGLLSAVMRPWKTTKDIKEWPKLSLWTLGFKEDISNPVITPWASNAPDAIRSLGALSEFLVKPPLIYRGLGKDFKGTFLLYLKYKDNQGKLGWIESLVGELPLEIIIEKQGGKINMLQFLKDGGIHIKKKNKGKFTNYCNGKVTLECINRGKHSSNPITRKRATFADNVRHWVKKGLNGLAIQLGGLIRYSYGYPVYWSDSIPDKYKWVSTYLQDHPDVTGMAIGGGALGEDDLGPRIIVRNSYSNIISDKNDSRWEGLDKIEAIRHFMNETNYNPKFKISPELEKFRKDNFDKDAAYNTNDNAWKQSIMSRILTGDMEGTPELMEESNKFMLDFNKRLGKFQQGGSFNLVDYIKAIENPNKIGWNGEVWVAPPEGKGYDPNLRGYGIDVEYNIAAKKLTEGRKGRYLTDEEMTNLMNLHLDYVRGVANRRIEGFNKLSPARLGVLLGMLYRGDSIKGINVNEPNDLKFFNQIHDYYKKVGVAERAKLSNNYLLAHNNYLSTKNPKIIINLNNAPMLNTDNTSVVKPTYLPIENRKARYPTKKGSYVETMTRGENFIENLKEKVRVENLMDNLKPKIKESYKFPISFNKKGGIIKASLGTTFGKINNFLGSDTGKSIINGITSIGSAIKSNNLLGGMPLILPKVELTLKLSRKKVQAHNYGYNRALDYIRNIHDPNNPNAFGGDIFLNHFANLIANQFTLGYDEEAEAKKLLIDLQVKLLQVDTMSGAINSFADAGMNMLLNLLNKPKFDNSKNNYSVSNSGNKSTITTNIGGISTSNTYNIPNIPTIKSNF